MKTQRPKTEMAEWQKSELLAASEAYKAIFRPTPGLTRETFDSFEFSAERTLISASANLFGDCSNSYVDIIAQCIQRRVS